MLSLQELFSVQGKVALVTGASSGIGRLMALTLAEGGAAVVLLGARRTRLDEAAEQIRQDGRARAPLVCDLRHREQVERAADEAAQAFGAPDILVNAAGVNPRPLVEDITRQMWDETMAINLEAPFLLAQRAGAGHAGAGLGTHHQHLVAAGDPRLQQQRRLRRVERRGRAMTRGLAEAWSRYGVTCNAIGPGYVPTGMTTGSLRRRRARALGRGAHPDRPQQPRWRTCAGSPCSWPAAPATTSPARPSSSTAACRSR